MAATSRSRKSDSLVPETSGVSDEALLARFLDGSDAAFSALMRRHEQRIFALALRMMGNRSDALDATQEAFIAAFRRARSFRGEAAFGTWLYRIAVNACKDLLRKRSRLPAVSEEVVVERANVATAPDERAIARLDLARALASLQEDYREAVVMHDLGGIPYDEIAKITDTNIGTVKSRISRGRARLAELLEQSDQASASKG